MLRPLINLLIILYFCVFTETVCAHAKPTNSCQVSKKNCSLNAGFESEILKLAGDSFKKVEVLKQDAEFQTLVGKLQNKIPPSLKSQQSPVEPYIFVSFSMGEKALLNLAKETKEFGGTIVLRGFKEGSYKKTAFALQKIIEKTGQGFLIDPELYTLFSARSVPAFILTKPFEVQKATPLHDRLQGHVSIRYALETFAKAGDFQEQANFILKRGEAQ